MYGITETTAFGTALEAAGPLERLPIGRPLPNYRTNLLDAALQPVPPGVAAELYIAGPGVACGYLGRPQRRLGCACDGDARSQGQRVLRRGRGAISRPARARGIGAQQIEAEGIRNFQATVSQGICESYLRLRGIEATLQLAQSTNAKVVMIGGGRDGIPVILNGLDTPLAPPAGPGTAPPPAPGAIAAPTSNPVAESSDSRNWLALLSSPLQPLINWFDKSSTPAHPQ